MNLSQAHPKRPSEKPWQREVEEGARVPEEMTKRIFGFRL